ncbi:uncharacterized protein [Ptychodera flava]|uniref:uncharacterized protein n=1 Tax=Ptychodera flava TaxID=63121 RepID=UPI00396A901F
MAPPGIWTRCLFRLPELSYGEVETFVKREAKTPRRTLQRAHKFFFEEYIHKYEVQVFDNGVKIRAKCYRSLKKNESPHSILVTLSGTSPCAISHWQCSCAAGMGLCNHVVAILLQTAQFKARKLKYVPPPVSKTSYPQKWHIPSRRFGISARPIHKVVVKKSEHAESRKNSQKRTVGAVSSKLYNPIRNYPDYDGLVALHHSFSYSDLLISKALLPNYDNIDKVDTQFGPVPVGSVLSYQHPISPADTILKIENAPEFPLLPLENYIIPSQYSFVFSEKELEYYNGIAINREDSIIIEQSTRKQSECHEWFQFRQPRLTASQFKNICSRKGNFETLAHRLKNAKLIQTPAMKYGLDHENDAVNAYVNERNVNVYKCGLIINPSCPHLGATPDERVYDPDEDPPFGLIEQKCPVAESVHNCQYLKMNNGALKLKTSHQYYYQIMGQMGISGLSWCDFVVWTPNGMRIERIRSNLQEFAEMKMKLDKFYFENYLPLFLTKN